MLFTPYSAYFSGIGGSDTKKSYILAILIISVSTLVINLPPPNEPTERAETCIVTSGNGWIYTDDNFELLPGQDKSYSFGTLSANEVVLWSVNYHSNQYCGFWLERPNSTRIYPANTTDGFVPDCPGTWKFFVFLDSSAPQKARIDLEIIELGQRIQFNPADSYFNTTTPFFWFYGGVVVQTFPHSFYFEGLYSLDGNNWSLITEFPFSWVLPSIIFPEGNSTVYARVDYCYSTFKYSITAQKNFTIDTGKPEVTIIEPDSELEILNMRNVSIRWNASDNGTGVKLFRCSVDGVEWREFDGDIFETTVENLSDGFHNVSIKAFDKAMNWNASTRTVLIDTEAPISTVTILDDGAVNISSKDITTGVLRTFYRIDNGTWMNYSAPIRITEEGRHSIDYYSIDNAGNIENVQTVWVANENAALALISSPTGIIVLSSAFAAVIGFAYYFFVMRRNYKSIRE